MQVRCLTLTFCDVISIIDGHKIAKKLSIQITKQTKSVKKILKECNVAQSTINSTNELWDLSDVLLPSNSFWESSRMPLGDGTVPFNVKSEAIQSYLLLKRSEEEIKLLRQDLSNAIDYYERKQQLLSERVKQLLHKESLSIYHKGTICLLTLHSWKIELAISKLKSIRTDFQHGSSLESGDIQLNSDDSDSDTSDADSDIGRNSDCSSSDDD